LSGPDIDDGPKVWFVPTFKVADAAVANPSPRTIARTGARTLFIVTVLPSPSLAMTSPRRFMFPSYSRVTSEVKTSEPAASGSKSSALQDISAGANAHRNTGNANRTALGAVMR
jgi:hypothetical protein